jgi:hypothetical protein
MVYFRLYFTTFTHPAPDPQILNVQGAPRPKVRSKNYHGARAVPPDDGSPYYFFTIDDQLVYLSFFQDWGPLNLAMVYKACILFHELLQVRIHMETQSRRTTLDVFLYRTKNWQATDSSCTHPTTRVVRRMLLFSWLCTQYVDMCHQFCIQNSQCS